jgi:L-iditol 2-dehydrogenase
MWRQVMTDWGQFRREEVPVPKPGPGEVLLQVARVGVCGSDLAILRGKHPYARPPLVLGHEVSGVVCQLGPDGEGPPPGTRVTVIPHLVCGQCRACRAERYNLCNRLRCLGAQADGAHAEYLVMPAEMVLPLPEGMSLADGALVEPAAVAYHGIRRAEIRPEDRVLVIGAGPIGAFAAQAARALGARAVYVADLLESRLALARQLGADGTIDTSRESLAEGLTRLGLDPAEIDVFADCVGGAGAVLDQCLALANRGSRLVMLGVLGTDYHLPHLPDFVEHELTLLGTTMYTPRDYREVLALLAAGQIRTEGIITHRYPLERAPEVLAAMEAHRDRYFKVLLVGEVADIPPFEGETVDSGEHLSGVAL